MAKRDLRKIDSILQHAQPMLAVGLARYSKNPAYWVEIFKYSSSSTNRPPEFRITVQWSFVKRDGELVEGHSSSRSYVAAVSAAEHFIERVEKKIGDGWYFHDLDIEDQFNTHGIAGYVRNAAITWKTGKTSEKSRAYSAPPQPKPQLTRKDRVRELQRKRKAKAEW